MIASLRRPTITVALPIYNGEQYVKGAVASILAQPVDLELIVSDDASRDRSVAIVEAFADPRIRILHNNTNVGIFGNLNRCIEAAHSDLIQVFSQDDMMMPGFLASQAALLAKHPDAGLVYGSPVYIDASGNVIGTNDSDSTPERIERPLYVWISSHYGALPASISSIMVPRRTFETIGLFNPEYPLAGDLEFYNRAAERFVILRNKAVLHAVRSHARMTSALPTSGARYLKEELQLNQWYRRQWNENDWRAVNRFRADMRGRYHLGWIARAALAGRFSAAVHGLREVSEIYPIPSVLRWRVKRFFNPRLRPTPEIKAP